MNILKIKVNNPYYEKEYIALNNKLSNWTNFIINYQKDNEDFFSFIDVTGKHITINPKNFASVEVLDGTVRKEVE